MARLKYLKLPKKPKSSASVAVKQRFLEKVKAIKNANNERARINAENDKLTKQIAGISGTDVAPKAFAVANRFSAFNKPKRKSGAKKTTRKPAKKTARKKSRR